jgi:hypothetical protein
MAFATALLAIVGAVVIAASAAAESEMLGGGAYGACPRCKEGVCYREIVTYRCKQVPDKKPIKKTVYECREVPYCQHKLPRLGHGDCCPECDACPKFKKVLVKKEIVVGETCGTKCVPEKFVERIPVPCCRCGYTPPGSVAVPTASTTERLPRLENTTDEQLGISPTPETRPDRATARRVAVATATPSGDSPEQGARQTAAATMNPPSVLASSDDGGRETVSRQSIDDETATKGVSPLEGQPILLTPAKDR